MYARRIHIVSIYILKHNYNDIYFIHNLSISQLKVRLKLIQKDFCSEELS